MWRSKLLTEHIEFRGKGRREKVSWADREWLSILFSDIFKAITTMVDESSEFNNIVCASPRTFPFLFTLNMMISRFYEIFTFWNFSSQIVDLLKKSNKDSMNFSKCISFLGWLPIQKYLPSSKACSSCFQEFSTWIAALGIVCSKFIYWPGIYQILALLLILTR